MTALNERLDEIRAAGEAKRPPEVTALMHRATAELAESGIMERLTTSGSTAPSFARPGLTGKTVRLAGLLRKGPVVLSFFRGRW